MARNRFKPPDDLAYTFQRMCAPFGGPQELSHRPTHELEYLLMFPGFVYVSSVWAPQVDLKEHGYLPDSPYVILDSNLSYLYTERAVDGFFGLREHDQELLKQAEHGDFVHIRFTSQLGPELGVLWLATKLPPERRRYQIDRWEHEVTAQQRRLNEHELFFHTTCLGPQVIESFFLPGRWEEQYLPSNIIAHPDAERQEHDPAHPIILYPRTGGWLTFQQDGSLVVMREAKGQGTRRLRTGPACSLFLHLDNRLLPAPHPVYRDSPTRFSGSDWSGTDPYLHLEATLDRADGPTLQFEVEVPDFAEHAQDLWLGVADENGEISFLRGHERVNLFFPESTEGLPVAAASFRVVGQWQAHSVLVFQGEELLSTLPLEQVLTLEDSRVLTLRLTVLHD